MQFLPIAEKGAPKREATFSEGDIVELDELDLEAESQEVCCGGTPPPKSNPFERPGYSLKPYVRAFIKTEGIDVALVRTELEASDYIGTFLARLGLIRDDYKVSPGLYGVGCPGKDSPVIVTANYKLTFDAVRKELSGVDCWLLILDTCGINVWCAAGKKTFSTNELVQRVIETGLADKVEHRRLIVPQLGATGVAAHEVKLKCGFRVIYGPIKASAIKAFLENDLQATADMRTVTFTLWERFELIPVEFYLFSKKIWWIFPLIFIISGIGPEFISLQQAWQRGLLASLAIIFGGISGAMIVPLLLPWIPGRSFSVKGLLVGLFFALVWLRTIPDANFLDKTGLLLAIVTISSYLAMNFTGSTPFTSPTGVEKEMKLAIPFQGVALLVGVIVWLIGPFVE